jgi:hydrogenase small subunit
MIRASAAILVAPGLSRKAIAKLEDVLAGEARPPVVWLVGQACSGCSVSLLNSVYYATPEELLLNVVDMEFHPTLMAATGDQAVAQADAARTAGGYVLVVEGAIPTGAAGKYCHVWPGMTMHDALVAFASGASFILAVGSCAAFGGMISANTNPTGAQSVQQVLGADPRLINIPGCPSHPDWIVGTIAYLLQNGQAPPLDAERRPTSYFSKRIHDYCHMRVEFCGEDHEAHRLSDIGCMEDLGCRGKQTYADCFMRKWNAGQPGRYGVNWCIGARSPCHGCTESSFPGMNSFFNEEDD